jgi:hypothetical protein
MRKFRYYDKDGCSLGDFNGNVMSCDGNVVTIEGVAERGLSSVICLAPGQFIAYLPLEEETSAA